MLAKNKKPNRKPAKAQSKSSKTRSAGAPSFSEGGGAVSSLAAAPPASSDGSPPASLDSRLDAVLRAEGIEQDSELRSGSLAGGGTDVLSSIPQKGQELLERFFGGGALLFGGIFLATGISVAVEAVCKVTNNPLPASIDDALVQYVEPVLTPSLLILFFFSISLGVLKQLQFSSQSGGVLYQEDDAE